MTADCVKIAVMTSLLLLLLSTAPQDWVEPFTPKGPVIQVEIEKRGVFEITTDPSHSPVTVKHVLGLVAKRFYDKQRLHREEYWVTQWGAPASKDQPLSSDAVVSGGSGIRLPFEMCDVDFVRGIVGIASDGLQRGGDSQIFVIKQDRLYLWRSYAVLGKVTKGMAVVDKVVRGDRILSMRVVPPRV